LAFIDFTTLHSLGIGTLAVSSGGFAFVNSSSYVYHIGDLIGVQENYTNLGGPASDATARLSILNASGKGWVQLASKPAVTIPEGQFSVFIVWHINEALVQSSVGLRAFNVTLTWNNSGPGQYAKLEFNYSSLFNATLTGPHITITNLGFNSVSYSANQAETPYIQGTVSFEGTGSAAVGIYLVDLSAGINCSVGGGSVTNGSGLPPMSIPNSYLGCPTTAGTYTVIIIISYLGDSATFVPIGTVTITTASTGGLSLFWIILIVAIVVVAAVLAFFLLRRIGKGSLVECGECGELIPDSTVACPKCGAEFEKEMVRCSRCGSTIGATSAVCPECSVLLIGKDEDPSAPAYARFTERYRIQARKELGENYNEGSFWEWWKRQGSYMPFNTWKQQIAGSPGMLPGAMSPQMANMESMRQQQEAAMQMGAQPQLQGAPPQQPMQPVEGAAPQPGEGKMKVCPSCGRSINDTFLVCPFCGAVTR
jgi:RNA polymerase subunit RPABC4/transcription elongation factor Spt4